MRKIIEIVKNMTINNGILVWTIILDKHRQTHVQHK